MNINEIKKRNADSGRHFFEAGTMAFFSSRVCSEVYEGRGGVFFVTSERYDPRSLDGWRPRNVEELGSAVGAMGASVVISSPAGLPPHLRVPPGDSGPEITRRYTVRQFHESGAVETLGEFQEHPTLYTAKAAAKKASAKGDEQNGNLHRQKPA